MKEAGRAVLMKAFRRIDLDDSGFISAAELGDAIRCAGHNPSLAEIDDLVSRFDVNNDRGIDFEGRRHTGLAVAGWMFGGDCV